MENKSQVAGILSIVSGVFGFLGAGSMLIMVKLMRSIFEMDSTFPQQFLGLFNLIYGIWGVILVILGILAIVGGVYAIQKKYWGLGLASAIAGIFTFFPCGVAAIVIIALARPEFKRPLTSPPAQPPVLQ